MTKEFKWLWVLTDLTKMHLFAKPTETISGAELSKVAQEILSTKTSLVSSLA